MLRRPALLSGGRLPFFRPVNFRPFIFLPLLVSPVRADDAALPEKIEFNRDVRPILSDTCFKCHGPDKKHREADRRLDTRDGALAENENVRAIVPGKLAESDAHVRIHATDADEQMPPPKSGKKLTARQIAILDRWIEQGAEYQPHWAYIVPVRPAVPPADDAAFVKNPLDALVLARQRELGLAHAAEADRTTLIRRVSLDLTGLPPTPAEVEAFATDQSADAYEKLIERLLASPAYGERMAIGWLDLVRYADSIGYHSDNPRNVWPYRDYVIRAFNENLPFDRFTIEQLAGDLLPNPTSDQKVASAYNRLLLTTEEGGAQPKDYEARAVTDRVRSIGTTWLAQTTGCCQCHDHKFDPILTRDFYRLGAFFADVKEAAIGKREDGMLIATPEEEAKVKAFDERIAALEAEVNELPKDLPKALPLPGFEDARIFVEDTREERKKLTAPLAKCLVTEAAPPRTVRVLPRGDWLNETGEAVEPGVPAFLPQPANADGHRLSRLDLARWIVARDNPLTARVFVNRLWKQFFGIGLSKVLDDMGAQGEPPVNPALLDWLACEFMDPSASQLSTLNSQPPHGWDVKRLVRLMVTSGTYRQSSQAPKALVERDPFNRELARQSRFRLDAEIVRDNALAISGLLVRKIGGPSVKPYQPAGYWENLNFPLREWHADTGEDQWRRGLYTWWQRSYLQPSLLAFDAPSREECTAERNRSNIPQQALALLNDPTYVEAARVFAARIVREGGADTAQRIAWAYRQALGRAPRADELKVTMTLFGKHLALYANDAPAAEQLLKAGLAPVAKDVNVSELAAWTSVARVILNLHETITRS